MKTYGPYNTRADRGHVHCELRRYLMKTAHRITLASWPAPQIAKLAMSCDTCTLARAVASTRLTPQSVTERDLRQVRASPGLTHMA
jgi:hypothetical protein